MLKFFEENKHEQRYTDEIGQRIIELAANEVASRGGLVPKLQLSAAQAVAASRKQIINTFADALRKFIDDPAKMNIEQRRAFLQAYHQTAGLTRNGLEELNRIIQATELECPAHATKLAWNFPQLKWICPILDCNYCV